MIENPILKVLSIFEKHKIKYLLIGGQACIVYGGAEFSRDTDFAVLCSQHNLKNINKALKSLKAEQIYFPELTEKYLKKGHACHFRCSAEGIENLRVDMISKMRGCGSFAKLWKNKYRVNLGGGVGINVIGLSDLIRSKKTQRDKDWLMIKRLVENDVFINRERPEDEKVAFWLLECRSPEILIDLVKKYPVVAKKAALKRPLLSSAFDADIKKLISRLNDEELKERNKDVLYWKPLKRELENMRHNVNP